MKQPWSRTDDRYIYTGKHFRRQNQRPMATVKTRRAMVPHRIYRRLRRHWVAMLSISWMGAVVMLTIWIALLMLEEMQ